jgi:hypothetical protein
MVELPASSTDGMVTQLFPRTWAANVQWMGVGIRPVMFDPIGSGCEGPGSRKPDEETSSTAILASWSTSIDGIEDWYVWTSSASESELVGVIVLLDAKLKGPDRRAWVGDVRSGRDCRRF